MSKKQLTRAYLIPVIFILSIVVLVANYHFREINLSIPTKNLSARDKTAFIRAIDLNSNQRIYSSSLTDIKAYDDFLHIKWKLPKEIKQDVVVEICVPELGLGLDEKQCFKDMGSLDSEDKSGGASNSCRYFLDYSKTDIWSKFMGRNNIDTKHVEFCQKNTAHNTNPNNIKDDKNNMFGGYIGQGLSSDGLLMVKDGVLQSVKPEDMLGGGASTNINNTYQTVSNYPANINNYYTNNSTQVLALSGKTLSLSGGGGSVVMPSEPIANSTTTGLLNSMDYNSFAAKENTLIFDSSFIRSGNNISLMPCLMDEILKHDGISWACTVDVDTDTDAQGLTYNATTNILGINGNPSTVNLTPYLDNTDSQALSYNATTRTISLTNGGSVILPPDQDTTYTAGTGISIISGSISSTLGTDVNSAEIVDGTIVAGDLANTGATAGSYGDSGVNVAQLTVNAQGQVTAVSNRSLLTATSTTTGVLSSADWTNFNAKENVLTFNGPLTRSGNTIGLASCSNNQILKYTAAGGWDCAVDVDTDTQGLTYNTNTNILGINGNASTVNLTPYLDNTDSQTLSMINLSDGNHSISISGGNSQNWSESQGLTYNATNNILGINGNSSTVNLTPYLDNTDSQTLSYNATTRTISLTNGGSVILPPDQDTTYTAGTGISIISGSISSTLGTDVNSAEIVDGTVVASDLANTGATAGSYGDSGVNVAQLTVNAQGQVTAVSNRSLLTATSTTTGVLSSADWTNFNAKENVLTFNGPLTRSGNTIGLTPCGNGQYYQYNGVGWVCTNGVVGSSYSAGSGLSLSSNVFSVNCSSATAVVFCQNGNNFGANAVIGTNDSFALSFETNNTTAATLSSTGEFLMRDPSNANGAFQVQNASSLPHFSVDTVNNRVLIGSNTTDVNSIALVLDSYNNVADPVSAAVNGAMYYNSSLNKFRCYENSAWVDCISSFPQILVEANRTTALTPTLTSTILPFNNATVNVGTTYNTATGLFTAPSTGIYEFETNVTMNYPTSSVLTSNRGDWYIELYNSSAASVLQQVWHGETNSTAGAQANSTNISTKKISLIAGQQVGIRIAVMNVSGPARTLYTTMPTANSIQITRIK
jgi:hypothetical protein